MRIKTALCKAMITVLALATVLPMPVYAKSRVTNAKLARILKSEWEAFKKDRKDIPGGMALQILSPKGDYFSTTGMEEGVRNNWHFRIASVTKAFTASGIMLLSDRKKLNIDDKITAYIPGTKTPYIPNTPEYDIPYKDEITIRMLLMHRAGVFDQSNNVVPLNEWTKKEAYAGKNYLEYMLAKDRKHTFTCDELVGVNARGRLSFFRPGTAYHYSDTGYSMLGKIIERVSGMPYGDFIRKNILMPNGLNDTSLPSGGHDQKIPDPFVRGYVWNNGRSEEVTQSNMSPHVAEGNIITSPKDLAKWWRKMMRGEAGIKKDTIQLMKKGETRPDAPDSTYGLGIVCSNERGYGHSGAHEGYLTMMYYYPDKDLVYVMFTNVWDCSDGMNSLMGQFKMMSAALEKVIRKIENRK